MMKIVILIAFGAFLGITRAQQSCDEDALARCVAEFNSFVTQFEIGEMRTLESLRDQCIIMDTTLHCSREILSGCHSILDAYVSGQLYSHKYMCDDINVYFQHQACFMSPELNFEVGQCQHDDMHYYNVTEARHLCGIVEHDLQCVKTHVENLCGSREAGEYQYDLNALRVQPLLSLLGCNITLTGFGFTSATSAPIASLMTSSTSQWPTSTSQPISLEVKDKIGGLDKSTVIWIAVGAGLLVFLVITIAIGIYICNRRKNQCTKKRASEQTYIDNGNVKATVSPEGSTALENPLYSVTHQTSGSIDLGITSTKTHSIDMIDSHVYEELPDQKPKV